MTVLIASAALFLASVLILPAPLKKCSLYCPDYFKQYCSTLLKSPYVCNCCQNKNKCTLEKHLYSASAAQQEYELARSESGSSICLTEDEALQLRQYCFLCFLDYWKALVGSCGRTDLCRFSLFYWEITAVNSRIPFPLKWMLKTIRGHRRFTVPLRHFTRKVSPKTIMSSSKESCPGVFPLTGWNRLT